MPVLADPGYEGAGHGVHVPVKKAAGVKGLDIDTRARNALIRWVRCLGERGFALLTQRWKTLQHVTASPGRIGLIARAALVLGAIRAQDDHVKVVGKTSLKSVFSACLRPHGQVDRCRARIVSAAARGASPKTTPTCSPKAAQPSAKGDRTAYSTATLQGHELGLKCWALCLDYAAKSQIFGNDHRERCIM